MKVGMQKWLLLALGVILLAGCGCGQPATTKARLASAPAQPFIFYDPTGNPSEMTPPLSESELCEITGWVTARTARPLWFIRVTPSFKPGKRGLVIAYLVPDEATARMRVGDVLELSEGETTPLPWKYVQVSLANQPFTDQLAKPSVVDLPFDWWLFALRDPEKGPDPEKDSPVPLEELVGIVDFVREPSNFKNLAPCPRPEPPIRSILKRGSDIEVTFGFQRGAWIALAHVPTGYRVKSWGVWMP